MSNKYVDIIIIGSGMAGLYSAYNIKQTSPNTSFLVLEKRSNFENAASILKIIDKKILLLIDSQFLLKRY